MKIGRKATLGMGNPTETSGSKNQRATGMRAMATPITTPPAAAIAKPMKVRISVNSMPRIRSPETRSW